MKLVTFSIQTPLGSISRVGALLDQNVIDLSLAYAASLKATSNTERFYEVAEALIPLDMIEFFRGGQKSLSAANDALTFVEAQVKAGIEPRGPKDERIVSNLDDVILLAPVLRPTSIRDTISFETHAKNFEKRTGKPIPDLWYKRPLYYKGNCDTVVGMDAEIDWPKYTEKLDYELEFGVYIGKTGRNIPAECATDYIAGYTIFNDISARDVLQEEVTMLLGPSKGKDMDSGNVMGPCVVTPDEFDVSNLRMQARVNGEVWSQGSTSDMFWSFEQIIEYISRSETLYPGDFIGSGTIAYGCGDELERWIQPGDTVELEVEGIGVLSNKIR
ncbi:fumarylacetoacetate hydrolase family protein [Porticoccaceae bacterium]|nr:fumarylacetoacetate hydrolase family protein [Porticoccaceae bacterium]